jgi:ABC-type siderophore export system fused ATPase/permease subunit
MKKSAIVWIFIAIITISLPLMNVYIRFIHAILSENGTCTYGNVTKGVNQVINRNRINEEYFKNLTRDNRQLAELICQNMLNETTVK